MLAVKTSRKWNRQSRLRHGLLVGTVARGRAGLGTYPSHPYDKARGKERQQLIQDEVRAMVEEERSSKAVGMGQ